MERRVAKIRAAALALMCGATVCAGAKDARVFSFSFRIPDSWIVEEDGRGTFFATGAIQQLSPPMVLAFGCTPSNERGCTRFTRPNPSKDAKFGCAGVTPETVSRADGLSETRWICAPYQLKEGWVSSGTLLFERDGAILAVSYLGGAGDTGALEFLSDLSGTLKMGTP